MQQFNSHTEHDTWPRLSFRGLNQYGPSVLEPDKSMFTMCWFQICCSMGVFQFALTCLDTHAFNRFVQGDQIKLASWRYGILYRLRQIWFNQDTLLIYSNCVVFTPKFINAYLRKDFFIYKFSCVYTMHNETHGYFSRISLNMSFNADGAYQVPELSQYI